MEVELQTLQLPVDYREVKQRVARIWEDLQPQVNDSEGGSGDGSKGWDDYVWRPRACEPQDSGSRVDGSSVSCPLPTSNSPDNFKRVWL